MEKKKWKIPSKIHFGPFLASIAPVKLGAVFHLVFHFFPVSGFEAVFHSIQARHDPKLMLSLAWLVAHICSGCKMSVKIWEHQRLQSQIAAIFYRKRTRRQPNRSGDAFLKESQKESQSLAIFRPKKNRQAFLEGGGKKSLRFFHLRQKFKSQSQFQKNGDTWCTQALRITWMLEACLSNTSSRASTDNKPSVSRITTSSFCVSSSEMYNLPFHACPIPARPLFLFPSLSLSISLSISLSLSLSFSCRLFLSPSLSLPLSLSLFVSLSLSLFLFLFVFSLYLSLICLFSLSLSLSLSISLYLLFFSLSLYLAVLSHFVRASVIGVCHALFS